MGKATAAHADVTIHIFHSENLAPQWEYILSYTPKPIIIPICCISMLMPVVGRWLHPLTPPPQWVFQFIHWRTGLSVCFLRNFKPNWLPSQCPSQFSPRPEFTFFFFFRERGVSFSGVADGYFWRCCSYLPCVVVYLQ